MRSEAFFDHIGQPRYMRLYVQNSTLTAVFTKAVPERRPAVYLHMRIDVRSLAVYQDYRCVPIDTIQCTRRGGPMIGARCPYCGQRIEFHDVWQTSRRLACLILGLYEKTYTVRMPSRLKRPAEE